MKRRPGLVVGLFAVGSFILAFALPASAQPALNTTITTAVVSLTSFDPPSPLLNPQYPAPVTLRHVAVGTPTHYRFSRFSDFRDARWVPYVSAPVVQVPASWFSDLNPPEPPNKQVVLYFQIRAKNPKAGTPTSLITNSTTGAKTLEQEPEFIQSNVRNKKVLVKFFG